LAPAYRCRTSTMGVAVGIEDIDHRKFSHCHDGFDHGVGHPLLLLYDAKAPNCQKNKIFKGLGYYSAWPKVADAAIKAVTTTRLAGCNVIKMSCDRLSQTPDCLAA
jgi:hypothetical protein